MAAVGGMQSDLDARFTFSDRLRHQLTAICRGIIEDVDANGHAFLRYETVHAGLQVATIVVARDHHQDFRGAIAFALPDPPKHGLGLSLSAD
jgi:hypothetical protein